METKESVYFLPITENCKSFCLLPSVVSDSSIFPSYTNVSLPSYVICRQRYANAVREQRNQFISEVATQELLTAKALDGVRIHREFCQFIFSKPSSKEKVTMTREEKRRLQKILDC